MVWRFPPERAGRAPQASRHNNGAEVAAVRRALIVDVAGGAGTEGGFGRVSDAEAEFVWVALEQLPTRDATPAPPASASS